MEFCKGKWVEMIKAAPSSLLVVGVEFKGIKILGMVSESLPVLHINLIDSLPGQGKSYEDFAKLGFCSS